MTRRIILFFIGVCFSTALFANPWTPKKPGSLRVIEDFDEEPQGRFPTSFKTYPFHRGKAMKTYVVREEQNNHYLHGSDVHEVGVPVFKNFDWDANRWPYFSWRWRAVELPRGGETNDAACGVYVVFGGYNGKSIKYIWSTTLLKDEVIENESGKFYTIVKESGSPKKGQWETLETNIQEDFKKLFREKLTQMPRGFAVLTDGDNTHSSSVCDYDDFKISEAKSLP